ncbi:MAG: HEAT repeat domain-containing protein, partial [Polyangiaceae bacterium]|nr:HEAT repeat domain-containing protein [Polyangiaceae bacterium]
LSSAQLASAVALGALARGPAALAALDDRFVRSDGTVAHALAVALVGPSRAPTSKLWALAEERGPASALALLAVASRDEPSSRRRLDAWLSSPDPRARAHVVMGLARSRDASWVGRVAGAYEGERDPSVRLAIARALLGVDAPAARATLRLARELDPDPGVRVAARGHRATVAPRGELVTVVGAAPGAALIVERPDGVALPVVVGADGLALVPGAAAGAGRASFAASP